MTEKISWFRRKLSPLQEGRNQLLLLIFVTHLILISADLLPALRDINLWDEAVFINTGKLLAEGQLTPFYRNPLVGILYALTYLPFWNSPFWMMQSAALGRLLLFALLWLAAYLVATRFEKRYSVFVMAGFILVFPVLTEILVNPSDALFAAMSAFAFWQFLGYYLHREKKHLLWVSVFLGLAALSRNDGLLLFMVFMGLVVILFAREKKDWKFFLSALPPFVLIVGGYLLVFGLVAGEFVFGTTERTYVAFQQGHMFVYAPFGECEHELGCLNDAVDVIFGTPAENDYSIFKAIRRNPTAYFERVIEIIKQLPQKLYYAYGLKTGYLMIILALRGVVALIRQKEFGLLALILAWPSYLLVYFLTFFREGYLMSIFFLIFSLGAIGITSIVKNLDNRPERLTWTALLMLVILVGIRSQRFWLYFGALILFVGIWLVYLVGRERNQHQHLAAIALMIFLGLGLILRGRFSTFEIREIRKYPEEQALLTLQEHLEPGSQVVSGAPGSMWAARMTYVSIYDAKFNVVSGEQIHAQMVDEGVAAIFVDHYLSKDNRHKWELIESQIGDGFERVYAGREGSIQVLLVNP